MIYLTLNLLGPFQAKIAQTNITNNFRTQKERALCAYLAVESGRQHHREILGELFWPERPEGYARTNLRQAISGVRRAFDAASSTARLFTITDDHIQFKPDSAYFLDIEEFDRLIEFTRQHDHIELERCETCMQKLSQAIDLYTGDFLEELSLPNTLSFQEWVMYQREHYFSNLLIALQKTINYHIQAGNNNVAQKYARRQVNLAPLEENAHRQLMTLLAIDGRRSSALEQYQLCRKILANELGIDPDIETTALYERIKAGIALDIRQPITTNRTNLPDQFTTFIGRETELDWFTDCIANPMIRLMTITGLSGVGKTRLAIQAGRKLLSAFPDGVWFVPLHGIHTIQLLAPSIAQTLEINTEGIDARSLLIETLKQKHLLLIIDNFEHLTEGTDLLFEILRNAPKVRIIVTSQQRLNYLAACNLDLRGLPYPDQFQSQENALKYAAVELFVARISRILATTNLADDDFTHIIRICHLVDGLPMALELAAANIATRTCQQIANDLEISLDSLNVTMADIPERHRSIRAVFDQSWKMLSDQERDIYCKLSIFHGEFSLNAAMGTTGATLPSITSLLNKSLLQTNSSGKYTLQPLLRQYAAEKLNEILANSAQASELQNGDDSSQTITRDPETNLPNKILFRDLFKHAIARAKRSQLHVILIIFDVQEILDWGRSENLLTATFLPRSIIEPIIKATRESDIVARMTNNKLAVILEDVSNLEYTPIVIHKIIAALQLPNIDQNTLADMINVGMSNYPEDGENVSELLNAAISTLKPVNQILNKSR